MTGEGEMLVSLRSLRSVEMTALLSMTALI